MLNQALNCKTFKANTYFIPLIFKYNVMCTNRSKVKIKLANLIFVKRQLNSKFYFTFNREMLSTINYV